MVPAARFLVPVLVVLLLAIVASPAAANVAGANGDITYAYDQYAPTGVVGYDSLVWIDSTTGADTRPETGPNPNNDLRSLGRIFGTPDGRNIARNSWQRVYIGGGTTGPYWTGAQLGTIDAIGLMTSSAPIFPGLVLGANFCGGSANIVATLADGTYLWHRFQIRRPNCNSSSGEVREHDHVITTAGGTPIRGGLFAVSGSSYNDPLGTIFAAGGDPNVVYASRNSGDVGFYRIDLTTSTATRLSTTLPFTPNDVTPDGRFIFGDTSNSIRRFDTQTQEVVTLLTGASASALAPASTPATYVQHPVVSPDGSLVAVHRVNAHDNRTQFDAIVVMGLDGGSGRVVRQLGPQQFTTSGSLNWQPAPGLEAKVEGGQLVGDLVELDLSIRNLLTTPVTALRYDDSGHAPGIIFNTDLYSPEYRAAFTMAAGPTPSLLDAVGAGARNEHQYVLGIDRPGNVQIRAQVSGTASTGSSVSDKDTMYLVARNRDLPRGEEAMMVAGGWAELQAATQEDFDQLMTRSLLDINRKLPASFKQPSPLERSLANESGLPDGALSWLPKDGQVAIQAYMAFSESRYNARSKVARTKLGSAYNFALQTPWDYWTNQISGDPLTTIPVGTAIFDEAAYWSIKGETAGRGYAKDAYALATDPKRQHEFSQSVQKSILDMDTKMRNIAKVAPGKARQIADLMQRDPMKAARLLGDVLGTIEGEAAFVAAETVFTPNKGAVARGIKNTGGRIVGLFDNVGDSNRTLKGMQAVAKTDDTLADAAKLGMPKQDQSRWQSIVRQVEEHAARKGYDVKIKLSFRPRNLHSAALGDEGAGKNMFLKGKAGNDIDLMLGMDPSGLGKLVIYKPVKPANYAKLPPSMRAELDQRFKDIEKARAEWLNPKSDMGRARTGKGVTLKSELTNQKTGEKIGTTTIKMRIAGYEKNGTISVKYLEHVVDGKVIVKPGKPKWVVSDYDGNAILRVDGKDLPGGAARGLIEAEVMRLQRENGVSMATSFHGFTHNGLDLPGKYYRNNFHFLLEGMTKQQANKALLRYLRKYATSDKDFEDLVKSYSYGDYVIHVTADAAVAAQGL